MTLDDKALAERVLERLCLGAQVDGIRFGPILQMLITHHEPKEKPIRGQVYVNLASPWLLFQARPSSLPSSEEAIVERGQEAELADLVSLRERIITKVELGEETAHLMMSFDDGRFFFMPGNHPAFESWQLGVALGDPSAPWLLVACPGGEIAIWAPDF